MLSYRQLGYSSFDQEKQGKLMNSEPAIPHLIYTSDTLVRVVVPAEHQHVARLERSRRFEAQCRFSRDLKKKAGIYERSSSYDETTAAEPSWQEAIFFALPGQKLQSPKQGVRLCSLQSKVFDYLYHDIMCQK